MQRFLIAAGLLFAAGCGGTKSGGPAVEGVITLDDKPLANASVLFIPQGQNMGQSGFGKTDAAGKFALGSADGKSKGVSAGDYKVVINKHVKPDGSDYVAKPDEDPMSANFKELLPPTYSNVEQTTLTATIPAEGKKDLSFPLRSKK